MLNLQILTTLIFASGTAMSITVLVTIEIPWTFDPDVLIEQYDTYDTFVIHKTNTV